MFSSLRTRFGIPGVISVIALVFAMLGGAYAANNNGGGKATASAKAKKGPRGPKGATGPAGPQGPAGANGKDGSNGANGASGAAGKSVTANSFNGGSEPTDEPCEELGGTELEVEGSGAKHYTCNGKDGKNGKDGEPWTLGGTLPAGATETGTWAFSTGDSPGNNGINIPISFTVPLETGLDGAHVHYLNAAGKELVLSFVTFETTEVEPTDCGSDIGPGVNATNPQANPGALCVYTGVASEFNTSAFPPTVNVGAFSATAQPGASVAGAVLNVLVKTTSNGAYGSGTWAVTAP